MENVRALNEAVKKHGFTPVEGQEIQKILSKDRFGKRGSINQNSENSLFIHRTSTRIILFRHENDLPSQKDMNGFLGKLRTYAENIGIAPDNLTVHRAKSDYGHVFAVIHQIPRSFRGN